MMRQLIRHLILATAHTIGTRIIDHKTGRDLGKALVIPWRGKIHIIGLQQAVCPSFLPQKRLTYWKQELGFTVHEKPDFKNIRQTERDSSTNDKKQS